MDALSRRGYRLFLCCFALLGCGAILLVTRWGIGLAPDSLVFVGAARSLSRGDGFVYLNDNGQFAPVTHYPPLYSLMLAGSSWVWNEPLVAARWVGAIFFAGNIALIGDMVYGSTRSVPAALFAAFIMLSSFPMVQIHSMAWTEPASIFFGFLGLQGLVKYLQGKGRWIYYASASSVALSCLTRYGGIPFVLTGIALCFIAERRWQRKLADAAGFMLLGSLPLVVWLLRNWWIGGSPVNRTLGLYLPGILALKQALETVGLWLFPSPVVTQSPWLNALALGTGAFFLWRLVRTGEFAKSPYRLLSALFFVLYWTFIVAARFLIDQAIEFETRILAPAYVALLILAVSAATQWIASARTKIKSWKWFGFDALVIAVTVLQMTNGIAWSWYSYAEGVGYNGKQWRESELIEFVRTVDQKVPVFTNAPDVLYLLTGRVAQMIPRKVAPDTRLPNHAYTGEVADLKRRLVEGAGVLVYFSAESRLWFLPSETELEKALPLQVFLAVADGKVYKAKNRPPS